MDYNFPFLEKLNFASFQNGGCAQNGRQKLFFDSKSVNIEYFFLSFRFKMASEIQNGG
jgi:hypothetical protein